MAWENVIVGWKHVVFNPDQIVPVDAQFVHFKEISINEYGIKDTQYYFIYRIPIYKKKNVRRK